MRADIKLKIEQIKNSKVPEGYRYSKAGLAPNDWKKGILSDVLYNEKRPVKKPKESYWRLGIRSHAKGTFHELVEDPETVDMDELYVVKENDMIVNITFAWEHAIALADKSDDGLLVSHRFPTYVFKEGQNPFFYKSVVIQKRFKELLVLISPGGAGRNRVMSKKDFLSLPCNIPYIKEQHKIAEILMQCDKVIELKQKLIEETQKLKKVFLRKMFPQKGVKAPEVRFAGFTEAWEQRKVGEWGNFYYGHSCPKWSVTEDATTPCIRYGEMYTKFGCKIDRVYSYTNIPKENLKFSKGTEVLVPRVGEDPMDYNHCTWLSLANVAIGEMISVYNTEQNPLFTAIMFNATLKYEFAKRVEGGSVTNLYYEKLLEIPVSFPNIEEQKKIASLFENLDTLITLHQRELQEWQNKKKALMQLLLTGIVRVKI